MDPQFEELATRLASQVSDAVSAAEKRLSERIDDTERRLTDGARMHRENLETLVKAAADGYGATLESIDRRLDKLETKWDTQIADHGRVLADHGQRISALEQAPK